MCIGADACRTKSASPPFILPQVKAGRATAVAALNPQRSPEFPHVPTTDELGIDMKNFQSRNWFGLFGTKSLPREVSLRLDVEIEKIARDLSSPDRAQRTLRAFVPLLASPRVVEKRSIAERRMQSAPR